MHVNPNIPQYIDWAFCILLLPLMVLFLPIEKWLVNNTPFVLMLVLWLYTVYFINRKYLIPMFFKDRKSCLIAVFILLGMLLVTYAITQFHLTEFWHGGNNWRHRPRRIPNRLRLQEQGVWFLFFVVSGFSMAVGLLTQLFRQITMRQELEREKEKAELALYKAQINPHFLFNTLNTLYGLVVTKSDKAEDAFMQFMGLTQYMYTYATQEKVGLDSEVEYIKQYIDLQRLRLNEHVDIDFNYTNDRMYSDLVIAPMLLITFVENAIKYGTSSHLPSHVSISIDIKKGELLFLSDNTLFSDKKGKAGNGIGIRNCRKRLELLYPKAHILQIESRDNYFHVQLKIKLV